MKAGGALGGDYNRGLLISHCAINGRHENLYPTFDRHIRRVEGKYRRLVYEPFGLLNRLHTLALLPAPIKATRLLKSALG